MASPRKLAGPRRCTGLRTSRKDCQNWVNMKRPRKLYWERAGDDVMCFLFICDACYAYADEVYGFHDDDYDEPWPVDSKGKFMETVECSLNNE